MIRSLAYNLVYEFHNCLLMGHDFWPDHDSEMWCCRCGAEPGDREQRLTPLMFLALWLAHSPHCWLLGHEWLIELKKSHEWADHWECRHCPATKPYVMRSKF